MYFIIGNYNFETVQSFTYLGSPINVNNYNSAEIKKRILLTNKGFYGLKRQEAKNGYREIFLCK